MSNPFEVATRGRRVKFIGCIDVSDMLLAGLLDKGVLTQDQHDQIKVRYFTAFSVFNITIGTHCIY